MEHHALNCTVGIEELSPAGNIVKITVHKNLTVTLGRDEFREMQLRITFPKKENKYSVKELVVHKKFLKDGKATIKLPDQRVHFMLSNCPPDKLMMFLKTLQTKLDCLKQEGFLSQRQKLFSGKNHQFEEISPLTLKDLQTSHNAKTNPQISSLAKPPTSSTAQVNKKRPTSSGENDSQKNDAKRKCLSGTCLMTNVNGISPSKVPATPVQLTKEQSGVLEAVIRGRSIFFTGSAGTGKSFLMKRILGSLPPNHTVATASTGVAACHIGGTTLHSFAGIGSGKAPLQQCIELASRSKVAQQWKTCKHLIIDEVSMVDGELFDKLETVARVVRRSDLPFGGIQLILCGDFLQLPPVAKLGESRKFCFESEGWQKCIEITMQLTDIKRQSDQVFINLLQQIRKGFCSDPMTRLLQDTKNNEIEKEGVLATRLCTHKVDVEDINVTSLKEITGESRMFVATDSEEGFAASLKSMCPSPGYLELKVGAQVMLCKNLDIQRGLVNGARGVVTEFEPSKNGYPIVKFVCGVMDVMKPVRWILKMGGGNIVVRKQIPLKLAWAISIHKSQGMTLDCVEMSLGKVFETGQAYVALSRAKSLEGLRITDFKPSCVKADPKVLRFYSRLDLNHRMAHNGIVDDNEIFRPNPSVHVRR